MRWSAHEIARLKFVGIEASRNGLFAFLPKRVIFRKLAVELLRTPYALAAKWNRIKATDEEQIDNLSPDDPTSDIDFDDDTIVNSVGCSFEGCDGENHGPHCGIDNW